MSDQGDRPRISDETLRLFGRIANGQCSEEDVRELERMASEDSEILNLYSDYCQLHIDLSLDVRGEFATQQLLSHIAHYAPLCDSIVPCSTSTGSKEGAFQERLTSSLRGNPLLGIAVAIVAVLLSASVFFAIRHGERSTAGGASPGSDNYQENERLGSPRTFPRRGAPGDRSLPLLGIGVVQLESGAVRMRIQEVGYLVAEGPAEFELVSPMRLRIDRGRLKVRVTEEPGHGFVVETPHGEVTDLGTEFGVDVSDINSTELVVFEGAVDLRMPGVANVPPSVQRLTGGDGVRFSRDGRINRIISINTGYGEKFLRPLDPSKQATRPVISNVTDSLRTKQTMRFYEIVHGGLAEDSLAYVDRPYEWNGLTSEGMPEFLIGADYVKTFNDDKFRKSVEVTVELGQAADLYLFWDDRMPIPKWLKRDFTDTGLEIGLDEKPTKHNGFRKHPLGVGPGADVDYVYSIWRRRVKSAGKVQLAYRLRDKTVGMFGIAAVAAPADQAADLREENEVKERLQKGTIQ